MLKLSKIAVAGISTCLLITGMSMAAEKEKKAPMTPEATLEKLDTDKDGKVSLAEYTAKCKDEASKEKMTKAFKGLDKDKDESVTLDELKAKVKKAKE